MAVVKRFLTVPEYRRLKGVAGKKGPNGRKLCACGAEVTGRRITWCSDACQREWADENDWTAIRWKVKSRDKGVCSACGWDTESASLEFCRKHPHYWTPEARAAARELRIPYGRMRGDWWDADHILPVVEGGSNRLENLRTLCIPCHGKETAALRQRMKRRRIEAKDLPLLTPTGAQIYE